MRLEPSDRTRIVMASLLTLVALPLVIAFTRDADREPTVAVVAPDARLASQLQPGSPPTVATTAAPAPTFTNGVEGDATWDRWPPDAAVAARCASSIADVGAQLVVTNLDTGRRATCTVIERPELPAGVVVKLDAPLFQALADLGESPIPVRISS